MSSFLEMEIARVRDEVEARLGAMGRKNRRRAIRRMCDCDDAAEVVRRRLAASGEISDDVWAREMALVDAPYYAAMELWPQDCPHADD